MHLNSQLRIVLAGKNPRSLMGTNKGLTLAGFTLSLPHLFIWIYIRLKVAAFAEYKLLAKANGTMNQLQSMAMSASKLCQLQWDPLNVFCPRYQMDPQIHVDPKVKQFVKNHKLKSCSKIKRGRLLTHSHPRKHWSESLAFLNRNTECMDHLCKNMFQ